MNGNHCGTCVHYRSYEDQISPASMSTTLVEFCAVGNDNHCAYCMPACADYKPDQEYIDFVGKTIDPEQSD